MPALPFKVQQPSIQEVQNFINENQDQIRFAKRKIENAKRQGDEHRLKEQENLERQEAERERLSTLPDNLGLGIVQYTSGVGVSGFDWSLTSFSNRTMANILLKGEDAHAAVTRFGESNPALVTVPSGFEVVSFADPQVDQFVCKKGSASGLTAGKMNAIKSTLVFRTGVTVSVYPILGSFLMPFAKWGDSGSWVIDMDGNWVGMVLGGHVGGGTPIFGYAIDSRTLVNDIEQSTGKKVTLS